MSESVSEAIAGEVRAQAARQRVTGRRLAAAAGLSEMSMSRRLNGRQPFTVDELAAVAGALGVTLADLIPQSLTIRLELEAIAA